MYQPYDKTQTREYIDSSQLFESIMELDERKRSVRGSMVWMKSRGIEYLQKSSYLESGERKQTTLGPRSPETEAIRTAFLESRKDVSERLRLLQRKMDQQARINIARGIARLPDLQARILRAFAKAGIGSERIKVVGIHALFAYEAMAGALFEPALTSTEDTDLLIDPRAPFKVITDENVRDDMLLGILQSADRSFEKTRQPFRARNKQNFLVDVIRPERKHPWKSEAFEADSTDLQPLPINGLVWLENAPAMRQMVLDTKGYPVAMAVPDPRLFAIHKFWLSQKPERGIKARRDKAQALAVAMLVMNELRHLPFDGRSLRMIPKEVFRTPKRHSKKHTMNYNTKTIRPSASSNLAAISATGARQSRPAITAMQTHPSR
jgi:hypothetical protein